MFIFPLFVLILAIISIRKDLLVSGPITRWDIFHIAIDISEALFCVVTILILLIMEMFRGAFQVMQGVANILYNLNDMHVDTWQFLKLLAVEIDKLSDTKRTRRKPKNEPKDISN